MKIDTEALEKHSFADLKSIRDFALNMQARLEQKEEEIRTSFDIRALKYWKEVSGIADRKMSERVKALFEQEFESSIY